MEAFTSRAVCSPQPKPSSNQQPLENANKCTTKNISINAQEPSCFKALQMVEQQLGQLRLKTTYQSEFGRSKFKVQRSQTTVPPLFGAKDNQLDETKKPKTSAQMQPSEKKEAMQPKLEQFKIKVEQPQPHPVCKAKPKLSDELQKRPETSYQIQPNEQKEAIQQKSCDLSCHQDPCGGFYLPAAGSFIRSEERISQIPRCYVSPLKWPPRDVPVPKWTTSYRSDISRIGAIIMKHDIHNHKNCGRTGSRCHHSMTLSRSLK